MIQNDLFNENCATVRSCISVAANAINCFYLCYNISGSNSERYVLRRISDNIAMYEIYSRISNNGSIRLAVKEHGCDKNRMVIKINSKKELSITTYDVPLSNDDIKIIEYIQKYHKYHIKGDYNMMKDINCIDSEADHTEKLMIIHQPIIIRNNVVFIDAHCSLSELICALKDNVVTLGFDVGLDIISIGNSAITQIFVIDASNINAIKLYIGDDPNSIDDARWEQIKRNTFEINTNK
jgi:hypothetical protein